MKPWATVSKHVTPRGGHSHGSLYSASSSSGHENFGFRETFCAHLAGKKAAPKNVGKPRVAAVWGCYFTQLRACQDSESSEHASLTVGGERNLPQTPQPSASSSCIGNVVYNLNMVPALAFYIWESKFCTTLGQGKENLSLREYLKLEPTL